MKTRRLLILALLVSCVLVSGARHMPGDMASLLPPSSVTEASTNGRLPARVQGSADNAYMAEVGGLPLSFVPNAGQTDPVVHFQVHAQGGTFFFTPDQVVFALPALAPPAALYLHFEGANPTPSVTGAEWLPGIVNYILGNDPAKWLTDLPTYAGIVYRELYPGVDLRYDGTQGNMHGLLKGTYTVAPGADPSRIRWHYDGAMSVRVDEATGDLLIQLDGEAEEGYRIAGGASQGGAVRTLIERAPVAWQSIGARRSPVSVRYVVASDGSIGFALGDYDPAYPLVLDPTLKFSTYLGGSNYDFGYDIAVDGDGNPYVTGQTWSTDFPKVSPCDPALGGLRDAFVTKLNSDGQYIVYSTYLGGSGSETGSEIAVDGSGSAYIVGTTISSDFPTTLNAYDTSLGGSQDGFVAKLNPAGNALVYSTYLGGSGEDYGYAIAVDEGNVAYVTGSTFSDDFPVHNHLSGQGRRGGMDDAFVAKLNPAGSGLFYSTYLGGTDSDGGTGITADSTGNAYVTGYSMSNTGFPATLLFGSPGGRPYAFVAKLAEHGGYAPAPQPPANPIYCIWLGGTGENRGGGIAVDRAGNAYVAGTTNATNFPTVNPYEANSQGQTDAFIAKLNPAGNALVYSTYLGGSRTETQVGISVDIQENIYVVGTTSSGDFPVVDALDNFLSGQFDLFITKLKADGSPPVYSTYFGGSGIEESKGGAVVYYAGTIYVTGSTTSAPEDYFPLVNSLDNTLGGGGDAFVAKIVEKTPPVATIDAIAPNPATRGRDTVHLQGSGQDTDEYGAYITAYLWTSDRDGPLSTQEDFSVPASELSAGTHIITFQVRDDEVEWSSRATATLEVRDPAPGAVRTLILANRQKLAAIYGASEADQVMGKLSALAAHGSVAGLVVRVEDDSIVASAYAAWDLNPASTGLANAVTAAIWDVIAARRTSYPNLQYLVIVGDDRVIPFRRVPNRAYRCNIFGVCQGRERDYAYVSANSTVGSALKAEMNLTDDYYADAVPTRLGSSGWDVRDLYIPDLGTGRLIETPAEINAQIDVFLAGQEISADSAVVTGYTFVTYGANAMCRELAGDNLTSNCTLIGEHWSGTDFISQVLNIRHDIVSHNGHAAHHIFGTPQSSRWVYPTDIANAAVDHTRALFYTVGCHAGLNVPPTNPAQPLDFPQAFAQRQVNYIANTGYGLGHAYGIAWSEQLMLDLSEHLVFGQSATVGLALVGAKHEYYLNDQDFDYYDEKILIESTLYGLPMYRYNTPATSRAREQDVAVVEDRRVTDLGNGLTVNSISYQFPPLTAQSTVDGRYYTLGGRSEYNDGQPIQPRYAADVSFPTTEAHGVVFRGGTYTEQVSFDPVVAQAVNEYITPEEPDFDAPNWYPARLHSLNSLERGDTLVTLLGQFDGGSETERIYDRLRYDIYYHTTSEDWTAPTISQVQSALHAGTATVTVGASDPSGIQAVVVAYTDGSGTWSSVELTQSGRSWTGSFSASSATRFFVQAADSAGNVAADDNGGLYYQPGEGTGFKMFLPVVQRSN